MRKDIHPTYNKEVSVNCICGNTFKVNATVAGPIRIEACPACHSTYTGVQQRIIVTGRREQFEARQKKMAALNPDKK